MRLPFRVLSPSGILTLSIVAAALVGIIGLELHHGVPGDTTAPATPARKQPEAPAAFRSDDIPSGQASRFAETILARPLFSPTRRPEANTADKRASDLGRLTGVVISPAGKSAIFAAPANGKPVVVEEEAHVGEYVVRSIDVGTVTIVGPDGQRILQPAFDPNPPKPPAPPVRNMQRIPSKIFPPSN